MDSKKKIPGSQISRDNMVIMIFSLLKKLFDKYAGTGQEVKKNKSIKDVYSTNKNNELRAETVKNKINELLSEGKLKSLRDRLSNIRASGLSNSLSVERYIEDTNTGTLFTNTNELMREIMTPAFVSNYNNVLSVNEEDLNFDTDEEDGGISKTEKKQMKKDMESRLKKNKLISAAPITKAKMFVPKAKRQKIMNELKLDNKNLSSEQKIEAALEYLENMDDGGNNVLDRMRYTVLLDYANSSGVSDESLIRDIQQNLLFFYSQQQKEIEEERKKKEAERLYNEERARKKKEEEERKKKEEEERVRREQIRAKAIQEEEEERARIEQEMKAKIKEPTLTFNGVTLSVDKWKILLGRTKRSVDTTYTANQRRLANIGLKDMMKRFAEENKTTEPAVQTALMEYKEYITPREPGTITQQVFKPDTSVRTTTPIGYVAQSMGMLSNELKDFKQDIKQQVSNASIKSQENFAKASEERYILYESLMEANNDIERSIQTLRDNTQLPLSYLNAVEQKIKKNLPERKETKDFLTPSQIGTVLQSIPDRYRDTLSPMVQTLLSGTADLNNIVMGLVGLGMISSGFTFGGEALRLAGGYLLNAYNIDLNDYLYTRNVDAPPPATVLPPNSNTATVFEEKRKMLSREQVSKRAEERKGREKQTEDIRNLMTTPEEDIVNPEFVDVGNLSDSDREYIESKAESLTDNVIDELGGVSKDDAQIIRENARRYIREQFSRLRYGITEQLFRPSDVADAIDELDMPLGFFDYIRNIGGLPSALMANIPRIPLSELRNALPTLTEIKSNIPIPFIRGAKPDLIQVLGPDGKPTDDRKSMKDRKFLPSRDELKEGAIGGVEGAIIPAAVRGGPMGAVGGMATGAVGGAAIASITSPMIRRYYEQQGYDMNDPLIKSYMNKITALPPLVAGAIIGAYGLGEGVLSGSGITEKKITVDPSVLAETKAVDQQEGKEPKKWITKAIMPTPDILDETRQEKFIDDLEYAAFNYIEPGSEGANGNLKTNPLKRSQFLTDQIRYTNAGISTPSMLYNVEFPTNTPQKQMETYKLGQDMLPEMEFLVDDNADTFTPIGRHYPNNEDTAVQMFSPFANFSDVRNYWAINRKSDLYNLYA